MPKIPARRETNPLLVEMRCRDDKSVNIDLGQDLM
jgi:hypothetical protein